LEIISSPNIRYDRIIIISFALLALLTVSCHTFVERYEKSGPEMLSDQWDPRPSPGGRAGIDGDGLLLFSSDESKSVSILQEILRPVAQGSILSLSADMQCENVQPGKKAWNRARLLLVQHDGKKDRWDRPHLVSALIGTEAWGRYRSFFTVGSPTEKMRVIAQLGQCTGSFQLRNLHLVPVTQRPLYIRVKAAILSLWGVFFIFLLRACFLHGQNQRVLQVMLFLALVAIIIGTTLPGEMRKQVSNEVKSQIQATGEVFKQATSEVFNQATGEVFNQPVSWDLSKVGHFCFFAVFGLILAFLMNRKFVLPVLIHILLLAGGTEMAQFFIDGRSPLLRDFAIDAAGGLSSIILFTRMRIGTSTNEEDLTIA
jgi:VanZ family protein